MPKYHKSNARGPETEYLHDLFLAEISFNYTRFLVSRWWRKINHGDTV